ncbi:MAG: hypothetical protein AAGK05_03460 [Pseudomonadota bacterium]
MNVGDEVELICSSCDELSEFCLVSVLSINDKNVERRLECSSCGHEELEIIP